MKKLIEHAFSFVIHDVSYLGDFFSEKTEETANGRSGRGDSSISINVDGDDAMMDLIAVPVTM